MKRYIIKPAMLFCVGMAFYVYYGITWGAWKANLHLIIIYLFITVALGWAEYKKAQLRQRNQ